MDQKTTSLFLSLFTFSATGGLEKFNRAFLKALNKNSHAYALSLHDRQTSGKEYFPEEQYSFCSGSLPSFIRKAIKLTRSHDVIFLGHINIAPVGLLLKKMFPAKRFIQIVHGVEVWNELAGNKKKILESVDEIWAVSHFTKDKLIRNNRIASHKIRVFPNTIDPFLEQPSDISVPQYLRDRYDIGSDTKVLLSITRLSSAERYKGYDKMIHIMKDVLLQHPDLVYLIGGKGDEKELARVQQLIDERGLSDRVRLLGFIKSEELGDHYRLADLFVLPSQGEGFGIVFLEAAAYGVPSIAGNLDGATDALIDGALGKNVNPNDPFSLGHAVIESLYDLPDPQQRRSLQQKVFDTFGFDKYCERQRKFLESRLS